MDDDPLSHLRSCTIAHKPFQERDGHILFGELSWPKNVKTNFRIYTWAKATDSSTWEYYTLECIIFFLEHINIPHPQYCQIANEKGIQSVKRPDRKKLTDYLKGTAVSIPDNIDKSVEIPASVKCLTKDQLESSTTTTHLIEFPSFIKRDNQMNEESEKVGIKASNGTGQESAKDESQEKNVYAESIEDVLELEAGDEILDYEYGSDVDDSPKNEKSSTAEQVEDPVKTSSKSAGEQQPVSKSDSASSRPSSSSDSKAGSRWEPEKALHWPSVSKQAKYRLMGMSNHHHALNEKLESITFMMNREKPENRLGLFKTNHWLDPLCAMTEKLFNNWMSSLKSDLLRNDASNIHTLLKLRLEVISKLLASSRGLPKGQLEIQRQLELMFDCIPKIAEKKAAAVPATPPSLMSLKHTTVLKLEAKPEVKMLVARTQNNPDPTHPQKSSVVASQNFKAVPNARLGSPPKKSAMLQIPNSRPTPNARLMGPPKQLPISSTRPEHLSEPYQRPEQLPDPYQRPEHHLRTEYLPDVGQGSERRFLEPYPQQRTVADRAELSFENPVFSGKGSVHLPSPMPHQRSEFVRERLEHRLEPRNERDRFEPREERGEQPPVFYDPIFLTTESPASRRHLETFARTQAEMMESQLIKQAHLMQMDRPETRTDVGPSLSVKERFQSRLDVAEVGPRNDWEMGKALEEALKMDAVLMEQAGTMRSRESQRPYFDDDRSRDSRSYFEDERARNLERGQLEERAYAQAVRSQNVLDLYEKEMRYASQSRELKIQHQDHDFGHNLQQPSSERADQMGLSPDRFRSVQRDEEFPAPCYPGEFAQQHQERRISELTLAPEGQRGVSPDRFRQPQQENYLPANISGPNHSKNITDEERDTIVKEVVDDQISPSIVGEKYGISTTQIRNWIRVAGHKLPSKYKVTKEKVVKERPKPTTVQNMRPEVEFLEEVTQPSVVPLKAGPWTNQIQFLKNLVNTLVKNPNGVAFRDPVDAIRLKIPDYYKVIRTPMNLHTVKLRLQNRFYRSGQQCLNDIEQIFKNVYSYFKPESKVWKKAKTLEGIYKTKLRWLPATEREIGSPNKLSKPDPTKKASITSSSNGTKETSGVAQNKRKADRISSSMTKKDSDHQTKSHEKELVLKKSRRNSRSPSKEKVKASDSKPMDQAIKSETGESRSKDDVKSKSPAQSGRRDVRARSRDRDDSKRKARSRSRSPVSARHKDDKKSRSKSRERVLKRVSRSPLPRRRVSRSPLPKRRVSRSPLPKRRASRSPLPSSRGKTDRRSRDQKKSRSKSRERLSNRMSRSPISKRASLSPSRARGDKRRGDESKSRDSKDLGRKASPSPPSYAADPIKIAEHKKPEISPGDLRSKIRQTSTSPQREENRKEPKSLDSNDLRSRIRRKSVSSQEVAQSRGVYKSRSRSPRLGDSQVTCIACMNSKHSIETCPDFSNLAMMHRWTLVLNMKVIPCFKCLATGHTSEECLYARKSCNLSVRCRVTNHPLLHVCAIDSNTPLDSHQKSMVQFIAKESQRIVDDQRRFIEEKLTKMLREQQAQTKTLLSKVFSETTKEKEHQENKKQAKEPEVSPQEVLEAAPLPQWVEICSICKSDQHTVKNCHKNYCKICGQRGHQSYQCDYERKKQERLRLEKLEKLEQEQRKKQQQQEEREQQQQEKEKLDQQHEKEKRQQDKEQEHRHDQGLSKSVINYEYSKVRAPPPPPSISGFRGSTSRPATFVPGPSRDLLRSSSPDIMRYMNPEMPSYQPVAKAFVPPPAPRRAYSGALWDQFCKNLLAKQKNPELANQMMDFWSLAGHNEATLRDFVSRNRPATRDLLRLLFVSELVKAPSSGYPPDVTVDALLDETTDFFMPRNPEETEEGRIKSLQLLSSFVCSKMRTMAAMFDINEDYITTVSSAIQLAVAKAGFGLVGLKRHYSAFGKDSLTAVLNEKLSSPNVPLPKGVTPNYVVTIVTDFVKDCCR